MDSLTFIQRTLIDLTGFLQIRNGADRCFLLPEGTKPCLISNFSLIEIKESDTIKNIVYPDPLISNL